MNPSLPRVLPLLLAGLVCTGGPAVRATGLVGGTNHVPVIPRSETETPRTTGDNWVPVILHNPPSRLAPPPAAAPGSLLATDSAWGGREAAPATFSAAATERVDAPRVRQTWTPEDEAEDDGSTRLTSGRRGWLAATVTLMEDQRLLNAEAEETEWRELLDDEEREDESAEPASLWRETTPWGLETGQNRDAGLNPDRSEQIEASDMTAPNPWLDLRPDSGRELEDDTAFPTFRPADDNR